jgi:hypothetical protein
MVNEAGAPLSPGAITSRWEHVLEELVCGRYGCTTPGIHAALSCI